MSSVAESVCVVLCEIDWGIRGVLSVLLFLQAGDGIRDAQESRGLGDVYKRQMSDYGMANILSVRLKGQQPLSCTATRAVNGIKTIVAAPTNGGTGSVSYTHLTLPTIYPV